MDIDDGPTGDADQRARTRRVSRFTRTFTAAWALFFFSKVVPLPGIIEAGTLGNYLAVAAWQAPLVGVTGAMLWDAWRRGA